MTSAALGLPRVLDRLEAHYGPPPRPLPAKALDWVLWENAAYLVSDERRRAAYLALKRATGLRPEGILGLSREALHEVASMGGMHAERRVQKLLSIAETVQEQCGGDLEAQLTRPLPEARRVLKKFPGIGDPGADKILLFTGTHALAALDSNGLRVLVRLGHSAEGKSYAATYRAACATLTPHLRRGCTWLMRAHDLLRAHGRALCKHKSPLCDECPLSDHCPSTS